MREFIEKNKFVSVMIAVMAVAVLFFLTDSVTKKVPGKKSGGEDVVMEIDGQNTTVSAFYDEMYKSGASEALMQRFIRGVASNGVETTDEMKSDAAEQAKSVVANFSSTTGDFTKEELDRQLKSLGYSGREELEEYLIDYAKQQKIVEDYLYNNFDDLKIRNISYILIRPEEKQEEASESSVTIEETASESEETSSENSSEIAEEEAKDDASAETQDVSGPTEDEQKRMDAVDEMLKSGKTFAETAKAHSEDPSTSKYGGVLGLVYKDTSSIDEAFLKAALELKEGETSNWVHSDSFGYFKIHCNAASDESVKKAYTEQKTEREKVDAEASKTTEDGTADSTAETSVTEEQSNPEQAEAVQTEPDFETVYEEILNGYGTSLSNIALWEKGKELGVKFADEDIENKIKKSLGVD